MSHDFLMHSGGACMHFPVFERLSAWEAGSIPCTCLSIAITYRFIF